MAEIRQKSIHSETIYAIFAIALVSLFILVNLTIGFVWPLYVLAMAAGFVISARFPKSGLFAIVFLTMIFERFFTLQPLLVGKAEYKLYPLDILMLGVIVGIFFQYFFNKEKIKFGKSELWLAFFIFLNFIYFLSGIFISESDRNLAFSTFKNYGFYALFYFIALYLIRAEADLQKLFKFFLAGAVSIIAFIVIGIFRGQGLWSEFTPLSTSGVRILAFTHGLYLVLAIIPVMAYLAFSKERKSAIWNILIVIWAAGILGTLMRHLWIALVVAGIALLFVSKKEETEKIKSIIWKFAGIALALLVLVFYATALLPNSKVSAFSENVFGAVWERTGSIGNFSADESYSWRSLVWEGAYKEFKNSPFFGVGTGHRIFVENPAYKYRDIVEIRNIHNSYLAIMIQLGAFGLVVFAYFVFQIFKNLVAAIRLGRVPAYYFGIFGILLIYLISLNFQPYLETNLLSLFFWINLGLARAITYKA